MGAPVMKLVWPAPEYLPSYVAALKLERIAANPAAFLASLDSSTGPWLPTLALGR